MSNLLKVLIGKVVNVVLARNQQKFKKEVNCELKAYRIVNGEYDHLVRSEKMGAALSDSLIQDSGVVTVGTHNYQLEENGVYRFYQTPLLSEQRIVLNGSVESAIGNMGYLWCYGNRDNSKTIDSLYSLLKTQQVVAGCSQLAFLARKILEELDLQCRLVSLVTLLPWNGYDDGHTFLEIYDEHSGWFVYDSSFHYVLGRGAKRLSLIDLVNAKRDREQLEPVKLPGSFGHGSFQSKSYDYGFWIDSIQSSPKEYIRWLLEKADAPLIYDAGKFVTYDHNLSSADKSRLGAKYELLSKEAFIERFY